MSSAAVKKAVRRVRFGDVVRQVKDQVDPARAGLDRYVAGEHMDTNDLRLRRWGEINGNYLGPAFRMRFRPGHVLYGSRRTYLRKVAVAAFPGICANTTFVLEPNDLSALLPEFLPFLMQTEAFNAHSIKQSKGSVNPYVNFSDLAWWEFFLPPLAQQRRLVMLFQRVEDALAALADAEISSERMRRSTLVHAFRPRRGSADEFPHHWVVRRVGEVGDVQLGQQRHPKYESGENVRPYLRVANVMDGWIDLSDVLEMHFPIADLAKFELVPGDILLNEGQSTELVGRSAIYRGEVLGCCFQKTLLRYRASKSLRPEFVQAFFQHCLYTGQFARMAVQTTSMAHLTAIRFEQMLIPLPPIREQVGIAERNESLGQAVRVIRRRRDQLHTVKSQLLAECSVS